MLGRLEKQIGADEASPVSMESILDEAIALLLANDAPRLHGLLERVEKGQLPGAARSGERAVPKMLMLASLLARTRRNLRLLGRDSNSADDGYGRSSAVSRIWP